MAHEYGGSAGRRMVDGEDPLGLGLVVGGDPNQRVALCRTSLCVGLPSLSPFNNTIVSQIIQMLLRTIYFKVYLFGFRSGNVSEEDREAMKTATAVRTMTKMMTIT